SSALIFSPLAVSAVAGASSTVSSLVWGVGLRFCSRSAITELLGGSSRPVARTEAIEQLRCALALVDQCTHVRASSTRGFHHRHPTKRIVAHVEHERVPVRGHDRLRPTCQAPS